MIYVALIRGINLGPARRVKMADLRAALQDAGYGDVRTYLQSGNAVVSTRRSASSLEKAVADALRDQLSLDVDVLVRTAAEMDAVVAGNPFADEDLPPTSLHAAFLAGDPPEIPDVHPDRIAVGDRVLYIAYAGPLQNAKAAKVTGSKKFPVMTARNWRTVLALQELARA